MKMKILVIGGGGREHALAWKLAQSPLVDTIYVAAGNAGTLSEAKCYNIDILPTDIPRLIHFAKYNQINFTVVGPEVPLSLGIVDKFLQNKLKIWGPTKYCAQLETSKSFAKNFMVKHKIPTAKFKVFHTALKAKSYINQQTTFPLVMKADGLAAGKGVVIAQNKAEALVFIDDIFNLNKFAYCTTHNIQYKTKNDSPTKLVIEEYLSGVEASFIVMADGSNIIAMANSQDHKRQLNGDLGPNTGGMGAYSPTPIITPLIHDRVITEVIQPVIDGMAQAKHKYTGFLYAGLMIDSSGNIKVLEFNCRMGDPEAQPIMMRLESDLVTMIESGIREQLDTVEVKWKAESAIGVVLATAGYPDDPQLGSLIEGLENDLFKDSSTKVFHASTHKDTGNNIITTGGRVLCVTALGANLNEAKSKAYNAIKQIEFEGMQYRTDIGHQAISHSA